MLTGTKKYSDQLKPYIKDVLVFEEREQNATTNLPFFADGYPGVVFSITTSGLFLHPKNKRLSDFFLYGQTIEPIEIYMEGAYKMIVFQLYPFATKILLGVDPKELNDDCYDLTELWNSTKATNLGALRTADSTPKQIDTISTFLAALAEKRSLNADQSVLLAINLILQFKGQITIKELTDKLFLTERTIERRFAKEIGIAPKIFCKIIQFQSSLSQISITEKSTMMDVVYKNGFTDQSHFIKTFKKYAGITPSEFQNLPALANFLPDML